MHCTMMYPSSTRSTRPEGTAMLKGCAPVSRKSPPQFTLVCSVHSCALAFDARENAQRTWPFSPRLCSSAGCATDGVNRSSPVCSLLPPTCLNASKMGLVLSHLEISRRVEVPFPLDCHAAAGALRRRTLGTKSTYPLTAGMHGLFLIAIV
jgi:hypothetical protein